MLRKVALFAILQTFQVNAAELDLGRGVELLAINGESPSTETKLQSGDNQLVVEFDARLKKGSKKESASTRPHIIIVSGLSQSASVSVELIARNHKQLEHAIEQKDNLFAVQIDGVDTDTEQFELPAAAGLFPYKDPVALVNSYNKSQGLVFDSGKIRALNEELEQVKGTQKQTDKKNDMSAFGETEATLQLKIWYSKASEEERSHFRDWMRKQQTGQ